MAIPDGERNFSVEFDFIDHKLMIITSDKHFISFPLRNESVGNFYLRFIGCLKKLEINAHIDTHPNETTDSIPFDKDKIHCTYVPEKAHRAWQVMVRANNVMNIFRSEFVGKSSPVHFFWGSFDLAVTRFSGRSAPEHPAGIPHIPDLIVKEAYSQEVSSCGFWPGNDYYPHAAFYSYAYPGPPDFKNAAIKPFEAFYHETLKEFILPYEEVIKAQNPEQTILDFFESTYSAAYDLGHWEKVLQVENYYLSKVRNSRNYI